MYKSPAVQFIHPYSLERGKDYFYREREIDCKHNTFFIVKFVSYEPCPATVIIQELSGRKIRCPRDDLFELKENNIQDTPLQPSSKARGLISRFELGEK
jgi:hypothetical protein